MIVATIAHPSGLPSSLAERAAALIHGAELRWLDAGLAVDLVVEGMDAAAVREALRPLQAEADIIVQPLRDRERRLLVADMDSTIVACECLDELADFVGMKAQVSEITTRAMKGELDFAGALRARVALLSGMEHAVIQRCLDERVRPAAGAAVLLATLGAKGVRTVLVTGGFDDFAAPVAASLGFDAHQANRLDIAEGRLTGRVLDPIIGAEGKRQVLLAEARAIGAEPAAAVALGDGANDVAMLQTAGLGIAVHGKPAAEAAADAAIRFGDLTTVLWALGLPRSEWRGAA